MDLSEISKESFYQDGGESSKCPFYDDCVCTPHADQFTNLIIECSSTTDSLNSGSEFEEFPPVKGSHFEISQFT